VVFWSEHFKESTNGTSHPSYITSHDTRPKESKGKETFEKLSPLKTDSCIHALNVWGLKRNSLAHKHFVNRKQHLVVRHNDKDDDDDDDDDNNNNNGMSD
jgi:hypothetical protein